MSAEEGSEASRRYFSELKFLSRYKIRGGRCGLVREFQLYLFHLYSDPE